MQHTKVKSSSAAKYFRGGGGGGQIRVQKNIRGQKKYKEANTPPPPPPYLEAATVCKICIRLVLDLNYKNVEIYNGQNTN